MGERQPPSSAELVENTQALRHFFNHLLGLLHVSRSQGMRDDVLLLLKTGYCSSSISTAGVRLTNMLDRSV